MAWSSPRTWTTGEVVTSAHMNQEIRDNLLALFPQQMTPASWTPTLEATGSNPSIGSTIGRRYQIGGEWKGWVRFTFSAISNPSGDGVYFVTLPVSAVGVASSAAGGAGQVLGSWQARNEANATQRAGHVLLRAADEIQFQTAETGLVDNDAPWVWGPSYVLTFQVVIPV